jgi:hypothetical protein
MSAPIAFQGPLQLLSWSDTGRGMRVVFEVMQDPENPHEFNPFKNFTLRDKKRVGQMFMAVMVQVDPDDDKPVAAPESGPKRSQVAYVLCDDPEFQRWANANAWEVSVHDHDTARSYICARCGVDSRSRLDSNPIAARKFDDMRDEFNEYRDEAFRVGVSK